ncbi:hypothetical protein [Brachybacterium phenoliresistens]|uniref:Uncharacterized protein n=1 Tax=Brachybacterium phenoliresistens TaxID=396014 RepID=Z9JPN2_9MICO|nr:hypothetical protein [Brachybacterium phenoliresistens]EWS79968.1 hypothetical protein BF93_08525 [Brachybacterium phenoliresistens]
MEINPYEARLRVLQLQDGVQMQREATPGTDTAGCPGCPYYWTCDVPHRAEDVHAPAEYDRDEVADQVPAREDYRPRDVDDIGWTDQWIEVDEEDADADALEEADGPAGHDALAPEGASGPRPGPAADPEETDSARRSDAARRSDPARPTAQERRRARRETADAEAALERRPRRGWKDLLRPRRG